MNEIRESLGTPAEQSENRALLVESWTCGCSLEQTDDFARWQPCSFHAHQTKPPGAGVVTS